MIIQEKDALFWS